MIKNCLLLLVAVFFIAPALAAAEWMTDVESAQKKAKAEHKVVLVDFTGSDWCGWCIKIRRDVLDTPAFEQYVQDKFVLVEIDVPNDAKRVGGAQQLESNKRLCARYGVDTFPTLLVLTPDGRVAGGVVGGADMEQVRKGLELALCNVQLLQQAASQQGVHKLRTLLCVYQNMEEDFPIAAQKLLAEIVEADTDDSLGLREQVSLQQERAALEARMQAVAHDEAKLLALIEEELPHASPANAQLLQDTAINIVQSHIYQDFANVKTVEDVLQIKHRLLTELLPLLPEEDRPEIQSQIELEFADPQKVLEMMLQQ